MKKLVTIFVAFSLTMALGQEAGPPGRIIEKSQGFQKASLDTEACTWQKDNKELGMLPAGELSRSRASFVKNKALSYMEEQIYNYMYEFGSMGGHHDFGVKSFDLTNDLMGEDMALWDRGFGWFARHYGYQAHNDQNNDLVVYTWHRYYEKIDRANWILLNVDDYTDDQAERESIMGQALAMRAFAHFHLVQVFSHAYAYDPDAPGIPYITENAKKYSRFDFIADNPKFPDLNQLKSLDESKGQNLTDKVVKGVEKGYKGILKRGKVSDVYTQLQNDLDDAVLLLEGSGAQAHRSHIDVSVAHGLRARVALAMEDWDTAAEHAGLAISTAEDNGKQLYSPEEYTADGFNSVEGSEWMWGSEIGEEEQTFYASFYSQMDARFMSYASLGGQKLITQELYNSFTETDVRKDLFIAPGEGEGDLLDYNQMKFLTPEIGSFAGDYLYMRLAEMYLIYAEALANKGEYVQAQQTLFDLINMRDPEYNISSNTGDALIDEIYLHRRMELWGEGHRSLDIRRLQMPLERPTDDNHNPELANIFFLPANDEMFLWRIPHHSYLEMDFEGEGSAQVEGELYEEPLLVAGGSEITLNAIPEEGYRFASWAEDGMIVSNSQQYIYTMPDRDVTITANFRPKSYTVTLETSPAGNVGGIATGEGIFQHGTEVTVKAIKAVGYTFDNWTEDGEQVTTNAHYTFEITDDRHLVANFSSSTYEITAIASPSEAGSVDGSGNYNHGEDVELEALTADEDYFFWRWREDGVTVSVSNPYGFTANRERMLVAEFSEAWWLTKENTDKQTATLQVLSDPEGAGTTDPPVPAAGAPIPLGTTVELTVDPVSGYSFSHWSEEGQTIGEDETYSFTIQEDLVLTLHFDKEPFIVSVEAHPTEGGEASVSENGEFFESEEATVTAEAAEGYAFLYWTQDLPAGFGGLYVSDMPAYTFEVEGDKHLVANFEEVEEYALTLNADPVGSGEVTGDGSYPAGTAVPVSFTTNPGYSFLFWSDGLDMFEEASFNFIMPGEDVELTAYFEKIQYTLTLSADPADGGSVTIDPDQESYTIGQEVLLTAQANDDYLFDGWSGDTEHLDDADQTETLLTMPAGDVSLTAHFALEHYSLTVSVDPDGAGTVTVNPDQESYAIDQEVLLTAQASDGYLFDGWSGDTEHLDNTDQSEALLTMPAGDVSLTASFIVDDVSVADRERTAITLYPNPASSRINVVTDGGMIKELRVVDMLGQMVYSTYVGDRRHQIGVSGLRSGVYFVQITTADAVQTHRIQVSR